MALGLEIPELIEHEPRLVKRLLRYVTVRLFIRTSMPLQHGPAYLFATGSTSVLSDGGDSWPDYIPWHPSHGFTDYALRLTGILPRPSLSGLRCKRIPRFVRHFITPAYLIASPGTTRTWLRIYHAMPFLDCSWSCRIYQSLSPKYY